MYLARVVLGSEPQVFHLTGALILQPRSWSFCSYKRGACAIGYTQTEAVLAATRRLEMPRPALRVRVERQEYRSR